MIRQLALALVCLTFTIGCGPKATTFSDRNRGMATQMLAAVKAKDKKQVAKVVEVAEGRTKQNNMTGSELGALQAAKDYADNDDWDSAVQLMQDSVDQSGGK